jgi:hypothetical protein
MISSCMKRLALERYQKDSVVVRGHVLHLLSLLSALAMTALLDDDVSGTTSTPLITYTMNQFFPHVDPDSYSADVRKDWDLSRHKSIAALRGILGMLKAIYYTRPVVRRQRLA